MVNLTIIKHKNITQRNLVDIIHLKSIAWPYSFNDQVAWIESNLNADDYHLLLKIDDIYVAYLNIINIKLLIDNQLYKSFGIGNVCSKEGGKGYGKLLMNKTKELIVKQNKVGLLFCKKNLINFYSQCGWQIVPKIKIQLDANTVNAESMILNYYNLFHIIRYEGKSF